MATHVGVDEPQFDGFRFNAGFIYGGWLWLWVIDVAQTKERGCTTRFAVENDEMRLPLLVN